MMDRTRNAGVLCLALLPLAGCRAASTPTLVPEAGAAETSRAGDARVGDGAHRSSAPMDGGIPDAGADATLCHGLFGNPTAKTGLSRGECSPECVYASSTFTPPVYDAGFIQSLIVNWIASTPYPPLTSDPYDGGVGDDDPPAMVCALLPDPDASASPRNYSLVTYESADAAAGAGAKVTHFGHCGVCSTLTNLAVYIRENDLVAPVRACGEGAIGNLDADVSCLEGLGFDLPCAEAWAYDTQHTSNVCLSVCVADLSAPYNVADGGLDPCIACDENQSGPVFKQIAGRTRRNSGLPNAICRPCSQVQPLVHSY